MKKKYIVCWIIKYKTTEIKGNDLFENHYQVFSEGTSKQNLKDARAKYNEALRKDAYSVNLCEIKKSTDY